jgi:type IV pilus assembly protein PilC
MVVAVPMFIDTFEELNIELPAITKAMIAFSRALTGYWWLLAILLFAACGIYLYASRTEQGKLAIGRYKLTKAPLRRLNALNAASQFASTMSTMLASGLPITRALDITASVATNYVFGLAVRKVKEGVEQGRSMVECMGEIPYFSKLLTEMTGVGERSGSMEETLEIVGDYFSNEVDLRSQRLLSALEPIITIVLAIVAVILLLGVYLPMFGMYGAM